jgi:hypothetical protein
MHGRLVASQLLVPGLAERGVEDRLTEDGSTASVSLSAFPAVRLLFDDGQALGDPPLPIEPDMELLSSSDSLEVTAGGGTVAAVPTGPVGELITAAIVARL